MLPIDVLLSQEFVYVRYVDDIRLFGRSEMEIRKAAVRMEVLCRDRGLIPQGKKVSIGEARSLRDALGTLPSINPGREPDGESKPVLPAMMAVEKFRSALAGKPLRITDKTRACFVLYRAEPSPRLLGYVLRLMPRHPEHIDAFVHYLGNYGKSEKIVDACVGYLQTTPYDYVQGELWHLLARLCPAPSMSELIVESTRVAKCRQACFAARWGACHFLCAAEKAGLGNHGKLLLNQSPLVQALLAPVLPPARYRKGDVVDKMLRGPSFEPGISLAQHLVRHRITHPYFGITDADLPTQVQNVFRGVGIIAAASSPVDPTGEILARRYNIAKWMRWKELFGNEYVHALQLLAQADPVFDSGRSRWLSYQNSFNDALLRALQDCLNAKGLAGAMRMRTVDRSGSEKLVQFGVLVDPNAPFARTFPVIARGFREANSRRNSLPGSHPYEEKGGARTQHLRPGEQRKLAALLAKAYAEIINQFEPILP